MAEGGGEIEDPSYVGDLIYDVGLHRGEDSDYYLKKGFRVVAVEANPALAADARARFAPELAAGRLTLVEGAVVEAPAGGVPAEGTPSGGPPQVRFFVNDEISEWSTARADWVERNAMLGTRSRAIEVAAVDLAQVMRAHGVPYYLKIDIEGMDLPCLAALRDVAARPAYVSIESEKRSFDRLVAEFDLLADLGYNAFQIVQQRGVDRRQEPVPSQEGRPAGHRFAKGASGPFGRDLPGPWLDRAQALRAYQKIFANYRLWGDYGLSRTAPGRFAKHALQRLLGLHLPGWYDTHARHRSVAP